jgi:nucleoside-diphosphate-sugar epimerase
VPNYRGKRVLVTGANGFIGSHLVARMMSEGADVTCLLRPSSLSWRFDHLALSPKIIRCTYDDQTYLNTQLAPLKPEFVFHLAAERDPAKLALADLEKRSACLGANILAAVSREYLQRFITIGTSLETASAGQPIGLHGKVKRRELSELRETAEKLGTAFSPTRTHYVYGPLQAAEKLIPLAIKAAHEGFALDLTDQYISKRYIYVGDIVDALLQIPRQPALPNDVQLITSDQSATNVEIIHKISELMDKPIQTRLGAFPQREFDRSNWDLLHAGSRMADWAPTTSLDQGLQACIDAAEGTIV